MRNFTAADSVHLHSDVDAQRHLAGHPCEPLVTTTVILGAASPALLYGLEAMVTASDDLQLVGSAQNLDDFLRLCTQTHNAVALVDPALIWRSVRRLWHAATSCCKVGRRLRPLTPGATCRRWREQHGRCRCQSPRRARIRVVQRKPTKPQNADVAPPPSGRTIAHARPTAIATRHNSSMDLSTFWLVRGEGAAGRSMGKTPVAAFGALAGGAVFIGLTLDPTTAGRRGRRVAGRRDGQCARWTGGRRDRLRRAVGRRGAARQRRPAAAVVAAASRAAFSSASNVSGARGFGKTRRPAAVASCNCSA